MKKITMIITMFFVFFTVIKAQGPYLKVNLGAGFPLGSQTFYNDKSSTEMESKILSLGKGINFGATFGTMFNKNVGFELGINYLMGLKTEEKTYNSSGGSAYTSTTTYKGSNLSFIPALVVESGLEGINPYARFGLIIGMPSYKISYKGYKSEESEIKYKGGIALGVNSALGIMFKMNEKMGFFIEANMNNLAYAASKSEVTKSVDDQGTDLLSTMSTNDKETKYYNNLKESDFKNLTDSDPDKDLKFKVPFGSIGLNVGIKIGF